MNAGNCDYLGILEQPIADYNYHHFGRAEGTLCCDMFHINQAVFRDFI